MDGGGQPFRRASEAIPRDRRRRDFGAYASRATADPKLGAAGNLLPHRRSILASPERLARIESEASGCVLGNAVNFPFPRINRAYQPKDLGPGFWEPVATELPLLVFSGSLDGNTPAEQAADQLKRCPNGMQHLIENAAHDDMLVPTEVHEAIVEFLQTGETDRLRSSLPTPVFAK